MVTVRRSRVRFAPQLWDQESPTVLPNSYLAFAYLMFIFSPTSTSPSPNKPLIDVLQAMKFTTNRPDWMKKRTMMARAGSQPKKARRDEVEEMEDLGEQDSELQEEKEEPKPVFETPEKMVEKGEQDPGLQKEGEEPKHVFETPKKKNLTGLSSLDCLFDWTLKSLEPTDPEPKKARHDEVEELRQSMSSSSAISINPAPAEVVEEEIICETPDEVKEKGKQEPEPKKGEEPKPLLNPAPAEVDAAKEVDAGLCQAANPEVRKSRVGSLERYVHII